MPNAACARPEVAEQVQHLTALLHAWQGGSDEALDRLVPLIYGGLQPSEVAEQVQHLNTLLRAWRASSPR